MSTFEKLIAELEATPSPLRGEVMHHAALRTVATWSEKRRCEVAYALQLLGFADAGDAFATRSRNAAALERQRGH